MAYTGQIVPIPLGNMGLYTDDAQTITPPQGLLRAENIEVKNGFIEKQPGSRKWNLKAILNPDTGKPARIAAIFDWWPDQTTQRMIAVTGDGRVYRFTDFTSFSEITPLQPPFVGAGNVAPATLKVTIPPFIVSGGQEQADSPRKLFIFTGNDPVQVIAGDAITRYSMQLPALDWSGRNQPYFGIVFLNRLWCFGNQNFPHLLYASNVNDQEDFQTFGATLAVNVFPGDNERLIAGINFKGRLFLLKRPLGIYFIDTSNPAAPIPQKLGDSFGGSSQQCLMQVLEDVWVGNCSGTITSGTATLNLGGLQQDDVVKDMKCFRYLSENTNPLVGSDQKALWYEAKKLAFFTFHSPSGMDTDRIFTIDFQSGNPRASMSTKETPLCMCLVKDISFVQRPFYGSNDGFIYQMDQDDRSVGGNGENNIGGHGYLMNFQLPYVDFGFVNPAYSEINKNFDFLEITFEPTGDWDLKADIFLDNVFSETVSFNLAQGDVMDDNFKLDVSRLSGPGLRSQRIPIHGQGRRISVKFYNDELNHNAKISAMTYYFRLASQQQRSS